MSRVHVRLEVPALFYIVSDCSNFFGGQALWDTERPIITAQPRGRKGLLSPQSIVMRSWASSPTPR